MIWKVISVASLIGINWEVIKIAVDLMNMPNEYAFLAGPGAILLLGMFNFWVFVRLLLFSESTRYASKKENKNDKVKIEDIDPSHDSWLDRP